MKCNVLAPHVRYLDGSLTMFEPMISSQVDVPDDDETSGAIEAKWLEPLEAAGEEATP